MAERKQLTELKRAQAKAAYNVHKRIREQEEEKAFRASLDAGNPLPGSGESYEPEPTPKKGK